MSILDQALCMGTSKQVIYSWNSQLKVKISKFSMARTVTDSMALKVDVYAYEIILLELLSGRKGMETRENGDTVEGNEGEYWNVKIRKAG